jgi:outer membrane protein TolC
MIRALLLILAVATAAEATELSLSEAFRLAREHSFELAASRARAGAAGEALRATRAERLPTLTATAGARFVDEIPVLDIRLSPQMAITREIGAKENYLGEISVTLPLFSGGRISAAIDLARANRDYYRALLKADTLQLLHRTRQEYLGLIRADRKVAVAVASLERARLIHGDVQSLYAAGAADSLDLLETGLAFSHAEFALAAAESDRRAGEIRLALLLGLPVDEPISLTSTFAEPSAEPILTPSVDPGRPELVASEARITAGEQAVTVATADLYPSLGVYAGYTFGRPNIDWSNERWNDYFTVGASLNWSFSVGRRQQHRRGEARAQLEAVRYQHDRLSEQFDLEAELAAEAVGLAYDRYGTALGELTIARSHYRLASRKHAEGSLSANRRLEIETTLTEAEAALAAALVDYHMALGNYYFVTGSSLLREE